LLTICRSSVNYPFKSGGHKKTPSQSKRRFYNLNPREEPL